MGLSCGMSLVKYVLFLFNLLCALAGIAFIVIGSISLTQIGDYDKIFEEYNVHAPSIILIVLGSVVFLIAFFGCCGALRESQCLTNLYASTLLVLIIGQIVLAAFIFVYRTDVADSAVRAYERIFENRNVPANREFIDTIQSNLNCCGLSSALDWVGAPPASCQIVNYTTGCRGEIRSFISRYSNIIGWVALGVVGIELVGFIFACCLANSIRNTARRYA